MLESVVSWLTPTVLFLLLNLVIGTIAFTSFRSSSSSSSSSADPSAADLSSASKLSRSPSIILDRLKLFNFYSSSSSSSSSSYRPSDPPATTETTQTVQIPKSEPCEPEPEPKPVTKPEPQPEQEHHIVRSQSDTQPAAGEMPKKLTKKMKKSATLKSAFSHFDFHEPEQELSPPKRPATMREREREKEKEEEEEEAEVDERADDFINRFKQQLKLQRLDSIIRYKDMLNRGN